MRVAIDSGGYLSASDAAYDANHGLAKGYVAFTSKASGFSSMAGSDSTGESFASSYDPAAKSAIQAYADLVSATGGIGYLTAVSLANHHKANKASTIDGEGVTYTGGEITVEDQIVHVDAVTPSSALGGDGAGPGWWHWIADHVGGLLYPDAETDRLDDAATAWHSAGDTISSYSSYLEVASSGLGRQESPEASLARAACAQVKGHIDALAQTFHDLGDVCSGFATDVREHRQMMEDELASFIKWTIGIQAVSHGLALFTLGGSELIGQSAQVAKIAAAANRVREILVALSAATIIRLSPIAKVAASAGRISIEIRPLATASARMAKVRAVGVAGEKAAKISKNTERIASVSRPGRYRIPDELDDVAQVIGEVKNVKRQGLTGQLKDFLAYAEARPGYTFVLYVRQGSGTALSGPLQEAVDAGRIVLRRTL